MKKTVVSFALPEPIKKAFEKHCKALGESRSAIATNIISKEIGNWRQQKIELKNHHTFHVNCDSLLIGIIIFGAEEHKLTPEQYIKRCLLASQFNHQKAGGKQ